MKNILLFILAVFVWSVETAHAQTETDGSEDRYFEINKNLDIFNSIVRELDLYYVDSLEMEKTIQNAIIGMLSTLDPYTEYIPEDNMDNFKTLTTGDYAGIGALISSRPYGDGKLAVTVTEAYGDMPAAKAGLKAGDIILSIDGQDVTRHGSQDNDGLDLTSEVSNKLKGKSGTEVHLKVERFGYKKPLDFSITRDNLHIPCVPYYGIVGDNIGYINYSDFRAESAREVKDALLDLKGQGIESLVIDLRNNGGGVLADAISIINMFVPKGEAVLSTRGKTKQSERIYRTTIQPIDTVMPLLVIVDEGSASASEIFAGALQDLDRAVIIGERTFGKGLVQSPHDVPYGGSLKITISKYYIPSGRCIQAIDYAHRSEDGRPERIPDSLTNEFKTHAGRTVRDGGGIQPDITITEEQMPHILYYLLSDNIIFDFATRWAAEHPEIGDVDTFALTDEDYQQFKDYIKARNFTYERGSEKTINLLKEVLKSEGYSSKSEKEVAALEEKLKPDLDHELEVFKTQICRFLSPEIVKRYYFRHGQIQEALKTDAQLKEAIKILKNKDLYARILTPGFQKTETDQQLTNNK